MEHFIISGSLIYDLTDHLPNFIILNNFSNLSPGIKLYKRDYSKFSESILVDEISSVDWQVLSNMSQTHQKCLSLFIEY